MSRESEVVEYLRADSELEDLLPGGIYSYVELGNAGITDLTMTPDVWTGGVFQPCAIVRAAANVPTGQLADIKTQTTDARQRIEVRIYQAGDTDMIDQAKDRIYALLMGHQLTGAWGAEWVFEVEAEQAPELPAGTYVQREDYMIRAFRRAA